MANYSVGNIEIGITGKNSNALKSIDETIAKLKEFKTIDKDLKKTFESVNKLSNSFEKLSACIKPHSSLLPISITPHFSFK